jgi:hypothetical protein
MTVNSRLYRGLEIHPLVFLRHRPSLGSAHNREKGFDAAVRIQEPAGQPRESRSRVFKLATDTYQCAGDARRACMVHAEQMIDRCPPDETFFEWDAGSTERIEMEANAQRRLMASKQSIFPGLMG